MMAATLDQLRRRAAIPAPEALIALGGRIVAAEGNMVRAAGLSLPVGAPVRLARAGGGWAPAEVSGFRDSEALCTLLDGDAALVAGGRAETSLAEAGDVRMVACGDALLGRVIDPLGAPLDGQGPIPASASWPLGGRHPEVHVLSRHDTACARVASGAGGLPSSPASTCCCGALP